MASRQYSETVFVVLAEYAPERLADLINYEKEVYQNSVLLSFAAEAMDGVSNSHLAIRTLTHLLDHADPVVREGALYGLCPHLHEASAYLIDRIERMITKDSSPGVRAAASDTLLYVDRSR